MTRDNIISERVANSYFFVLNVLEGSFSSIIKRSRGRESPPNARVAFGGLRGQSLNLNTDKREIRPR